MKDDDWYERYLAEQDEFTEKFMGTFAKAQEIVENGGDLTDIYKAMLDDKPNTGE